MGHRAAIIGLATGAVGFGFAAAASGPAPPAGLRRADASSPIVRSRDARLVAGRRAVLLSLRRIGRVTVACGADRRTRVSLRAARLLPTSDLVIASPRGATAATLQPSRHVARPPARIVAETWQIAPFAAAGVRVSTIRVTARPVMGGCAAAAMAIVGRDQGSTGTAATRAVAPRSVLARDPYVGVACPYPGPRRCERMGVAVWLRRPARSVHAAIDGRLLALDDPEWSAPARRDGRRRMFAGFLRPTRLTRERRELQLTLWVDGRVRTTMPVWRHAGWG